MSYRICIPTYKRDEPLCLKLLDDKSVELHLYVRIEEFTSGFYDSIKERDGLVFHMLKDVKDIGDTREQILQSCINDGIDYCVMLDDSVCCIKNNAALFKNTTEVIENAISLMKTDTMKDYVADFAFVKYSSIDDGKEVVLNRRYAYGQEYFTTFPCQCHIIDIKKVKEANIHYHSLEEYGFEDANFLGDLIKAGLIVIGRAYYCFTAAYANKPKTGGNHDALTSLKDLQNRYDKYNKMTMDYLKLDGTSVETRYRSYVGGNLSLINWDYDFYREVLVYKRHLNEDIIAKRLSTYSN